MDVTAIFNPLRINASPRSSSASLLHLIYPIFSFPFNPKYDNNSHAGRDSWLSCRGPHTLPKTRRAISGSGTCGPHTKMLHVRRGAMHCMARRRSALQKSRMPPSLLRRLQISAFARGAAQRAAKTMVIQHNRDLTRRKW